ncbi:MAG: hypothetical protein FJ255_02580 [Phycisphaerae bacterium]|nr:hypothetical protein [Phycisphaerae bacterium]
MIEPALSSARATPIERFLGPGRAGGPTTLLWLQPGYTDADVLAALNLGLDRVNRHAEAASPEADEVRLALHAAAALLLDPRTRGRARGEGGLDAAAALEHDAILTLAMFGGWNRKALHRLTLLAHARGLPSSQVYATLSRLTRRSNAGAEAAPVPAAPAAERRREPSTDPGMSILRRIVIGFVIVVAVLAVVGAAVTVSVRASRGGPRQAEAPIARAETQIPEQLFAAPGQATPRPAASPPASATVLDDVRACLDGLAVDPGEAVARFDEALGRLSAAWAGLAPDQRAATHHAVVEFVHRLRGEPDLAASAARSVVARTPPPVSPGEPPRPPAPGDVLRWAWGSGMVARLAQERDWPARIVQLLQRASAEAPSASSAPGAFERGAMLALARMVPTLVPRTVAVNVDEDRVKAWTEWGACVAAAAPDEAGADRMLLAALDALMLDGPEPHADRTTFDVLTWLGGRVRFSRGDESRAWALRLFDSSAISTGDLFALTRRLSQLPEMGGGRDASLVLATTASTRDRSQLRQRYATLWGMAQVASAQAASEAWVKASRRVAALADPATDQVASQLERAVLYSRLSESAWWAWLGHADASAAALAQAERLEAQVAAPQPGPKPLPDPGGDGGWVERYLAAQNAPTTRMQLLTEMNALPHNVGPLQAEVLVKEALRGSPVQVRRLASEIVQKQLRNAAVVNAMLEQLPTMPWTGENAALVSRVGFGALPASDDPARRIVARRLLVERLLELLASEGDAGRIDELSRELSSSYLGRATTAPPTPTSDRAPSDPPPAHLAVAQARARWRRIADGVVAVGREPLSIEQIERRLASRLRLAEGQVRTFAAEQLAVCELMAFTLAAERPEEAPRASEVLERLASERRAADHVLTQIRAAERAMLDLWLIRIGGPEQ